MKVKCVSRHAEDVGGIALAPGEVAEVEDDDPVTLGLIEEGVLILLPNESAEDPGDAPTGDENQETEQAEPDPAEGEPEEEPAKPAAKASAHSGSRKTKRGGSRA